MAFFRPFVRDPFFASPSSALFSPSSSLFFDEDPFFSAAPLYLYDTPTSRRRAGSRRGAAQQQQQLLKDQQAGNQDNAQVMVSGGDSGVSDKADKAATSASPASPSANNKQTSVANSNTDNDNDHHDTVSSLRQPRLLSPLSLLSAFSPSSSLLSARAVLPSMSVDMLSTDKEYTVHASVPGVAKQDLRVTVDDGVLTIEAERREETKQSRANTSPRQQQGQQHDKKEREEKAQPADGSAQQPMDTSAEDDSSPQYHHVESFYGRISRSITLPDDCNTDGMTAKHEDGVLKIIIPRLQDKRQRGTRLEIQ